MENCYEKQVVCTVLKINTLRCNSNQVMQVTSHGILTWYIKIRRVRDWSYGSVIKSTCWSCKSLRLDPQYPTVTYNHI